jgi:Ca-activated chloride channel family protein
VFGEQPKPLAPPAERRADASDGHMQLALRRHPPVVAPASPVVLPKTATDAELKMMSGAALLLIALMMIVIPRRRLAADGC